jgi:hypothetical protein
MTSFRNRMLMMAAVALVVVCVSAGLASAQSVAKGSFTLASEVRWQGATLPAGDYTFRMDSVASPVRIRLQGPSGGAFIVATVSDDCDGGKQSLLTIEHRGGRSFVSEMYLASIGQRLKYAVPKAPKEVQLAQGPVTTEKILIAMK